MSDTEKRAILDSAAQESNRAQKKLVEETMKKGKKAFRHNKQSWKNDLKRWSKWKKEVRKLIEDWKYEAGDDVLAAALADEVIDCVSRIILTNEEI